MEFTPTEEQIKFVWSQKRWDHMKVSMVESDAEFDRWLNEERAKAFDEGASALGDSFWDGDAGVVVNPYRKAD